MATVCTLGAAGTWHAASAAEAAAQAASPPPAAVAKQPAAPTPVRNFPVLEYQVEGNTLLQTIDVERAVMSHLGESRTVDDVEAARRELEKVYHDRGYKTVVVNIPQQAIGSGVVRLRVTEAAVGKLHIEGSRYHSLAVIRETLQELNEDSVPDFNEVQRQINEVNHSADLKVTPVLRASETPGKVDVDLRVKDELPVHATVEANNRYSSNTAKTRLVGELEYDNLFQRSQSLSIQYQVAPSNPSNAEVFSASYVIPTQEHGIWALYAVHSNSNIAAVGDVNVIGKGNIFGARLINSLPSSLPGFYHSFTAGLDYKDLKQNIALADGAGTIASPASYPSFTAQYSATLAGNPRDGKLIAATTGGRSATIFESSITFTIRGLGTDHTQFSDKRAGASPSFFIFHPSLERQQVLPWSWSLIGRVDGQLSSGPLLNNEQYSAGGADSVRGYTEAERLGDNGIRGSLELRTPQLLAQRFAAIERSYFLLFTEAAHLTVLEPLADQESEFSLASAGIGLRFKAYGLTVNLDGARILKDGSVTFAGRYRGLFQVNYTY